MEVGSIPAAEKYCPVEGRARCSGGVGEGVFLRSGLGFGWAVDGKEASLVWIGRCQQAWAVL